MINEKKIFDIAVMIIFAAFGIGALVAVFFGATHQLFTVAVCALMFGFSYAEYRKENHKK